MRRYYDSGPDCRVCGTKRINVVHDDQIARARSIETWARPSKSMGGMNYYDWAGIVYHEFEPVAAGPVPPAPADEYKRGYQAGYHAGIRSRHS